MMTPDRLLIVEDTKVFAQMLKSLVWQAHGFSSDIVESLAETKKLVEHNGADTYFAAIVDLQLPDAPHGEAIDAVVAANIPTIVFTGTADQTDEKDLWSKNIADYAHKSSAHSVEHVVWMVKRLFENSNKHILIVDASLPGRKAMSRLLKTQRFQVHSAASGEEALQLIESTPEMCLAIIDCNMEDMDGFTLASKIRLNRSKDNLEILGISSQEGRSHSARFIKAGADDFLLTPFLPEEFLCRVNRAVDRIDQYGKLKELNELKNRFLSTAAHDIRGPLSAIYNAARLLQKKDWSDERKSSMIKMIEDNACDMQTLLNELLDFSVIESGQLKLNCEQVNLSSIVLERVQLYSAEADAKQLSINTKIESTPPPLLVDRIKIQQVIDNLLTNAIKYSPCEGEIDVSLRHNDEDVQLEIIDCGPGISKEHQTKLFKPYQTLGTRSTAREKQTGLGLVIAKNIVDAHGGSIHYHNAPNRGAAFKLILPIKNACTTTMKIF